MNKFCNLAVVHLYPRSHRLLSPPHYAIFSPKLASTNLLSQRHAWPTTTSSTANGEGRTRAESTRWRRHERSAGRHPGRQEAAQSRHKRPISPPDRWPNSRRFRGQSQSQRPAAGPIGGVCAASTASSSKSNDGGHSGRSIAQDQRSQQWAERPGPQRSPSAGEGRSRGQGAPDPWWRGSWATCVVWTSAVWTGASGATQLCPAAPIPTPDASAGTVHLSVRVPRGLQQPGG